MNSKVTWPSMTAGRQGYDVTSNEDHVQAQPPTWPATLQQPSHSQQPQPNLLLQLTQILEWEIWNHNQTRATLVLEREQLTARISKLEYDLSQWRQSCQAVYAALEEHRTENGALREDIDGMANELSLLRQQQPFNIRANTFNEAPTCCPSDLTNTEVPEDDGGILHEEVQPKLEDDTSWRERFVQEVEERLRA